MGNLTSAGVASSCYPAQKPSQEASFSIYMPKLATLFPVQAECVEVCLHRSHKQQEEDTGIFYYLAKYERRHSSFTLEF